MWLCCSAADECSHSRVFFPNVYSYSTLTTNSASASNFNHDVNLFPVTAYWLPSLIPSSIIFFRDCFLFFCWWWWCDFSRQSNLGKHVGALTSGGAHCAARFHLLNHYFPLNRSRMQFFFCFVLLLSFSLQLIMETKIWEERSGSVEIPNHRQVREGGSASRWEASSFLIGWQCRAELFNIAFRPLRRSSVVSVLSRPGGFWRGEPFKFSRRAPCEASPVSGLQQVRRFSLPKAPTQPPSP